MSKTLLIRQLFLVLNTPTPPHCHHCGFRDARFWHWEEQLPRGKRFYPSHTANGFVGEEHGFQRGYDILLIPRAPEAVRTRRYLRYSNLIFQLMGDGSLCLVS